jgi:hypothetical protein
MVEPQQRLMGAGVDLRPALGKERGLRDALILSESMKPVKSQKRQLTENQIANFLL